MASRLTDRVQLYIDRRWAGQVPVTLAASTENFGLPLRPHIERIFTRHRNLVLFLPVGASVRLLAPLLQHKHNDPAVVCVDDAGRFAVSLVSGHVGGADALAERVAAILDATPVITSASHTLNTLAVDLLGRELGWTLDTDSPTITQVSAAVVNGEPVGLFQQADGRDWLPGGVALPTNLTVFESLADLKVTGCAAALVISDQEPIALGMPTVTYRPKSLVVGMGCRRGVPVEHLEELLLSAFAQANLSPKSIRCIATADIKADEAGLIALSDKYGVPLVCYSAEELNSVFHSLPEPAGVCRSSDGKVEGAGRPTPSAVAHRLLGVWGVSEPAAILASGAETLLVTRQKSDRATVSVARVPGDQVIPNSNPEE